jgi:hypothetical protein
MFLLGLFIGFVVGFVFGPKLRDEYNSVANK